MQVYKIKTKAVYGEETSSSQTAWQESETASSYHDSSSHTENVLLGYEVVAEEYRVNMKYLSDIRDVVYAFQALQTHHGVTLPGMTIDTKARVVIRELFVPADWAAFALDGLLEAGIDECFVETTRGRRIFKCHGCGTIEAPKLEKYGYDIRTFELTGVELKLPNEVLSVLYKNGLFEAPTSSPVAVVAVQKKEGPKNNPFAGLADLLNK